MTASQTSHNTIAIILAIIVTAGSAYFVGRYSRETPVAAPSQMQTTRDAIIPIGNQEPLALLLVDMQNEFLTPEMATHHADYASNVAELLADCRDKGIEVIHVRTEFSSAAELPPCFRSAFGDRVPCLRGSKGAQPIASAKEHSGEQIFYKKTFNGFAVDDLTRHLEAGKKKRLLIAGMTTDLCVFATVLGALDKGFDVSVVHDCCLASSDISHGFILNRYGGFLFTVVSHSEITE